MLGDGFGVGDVLHGEVGDTAFAVVVGTGFIHLGDVGVPQTGEDLRLELESPQGGFGGETLLHHLERDRAPRVLLDG